MLSEGTYSEETYDADAYADGDTADDMEEILERLALIEVKFERMEEKLDKLIAFGDRAATAADRLKDSPMFASLMGAKK